jgi:2,3-bisphosphoglycerate-dependent phosphoglycerate mutase
MTIYLLRHGETALNVARVLQPADTPLSTRGAAQASALATRMRRAGLMGIVSSHLPRALQTATDVGRDCGLEVQTCDLLQERNFGDWRGQSYDTLDFNPLLFADAPPCGESVHEFVTRVAAAFEHITNLRASMNGPLAVVTHGMVIRQMLTAHVSLAYGAAMPAHLGNTSVNRIRELAPYRVELLNCTRHLNDQTAHDAGSLSGG